MSETLNHSERSESLSAEALELQALNNEILNQEDSHDKKESHEVEEHWIDLTERKESHAKKLRLDANKITSLKFDQDERVYQVTIKDTISGPNGQQIPFESTLYIKQDQVGNATVYKPYKNENFINSYTINDEYTCYEEKGEKDSGGFIKYHNLYFKVWNTKETTDTNSSFNYEITFDEKKSETLMKKELLKANLNFDNITFGNDTELSEQGRKDRQELIKNLDFLNYQDAEDTEKYIKGEPNKWGSIDEIYKASTMGTNDIVKELTKNIKLDKNIKKENGKWEFTRKLVLSDDNGTFNEIGIEIKYILDDKGNLKIDEDSLKSQNISLYGANIEGISFKADGLNIKMDVDKNALEKYRLERTKLHNGINSMMTNTQGTEIIGIENETKIFNYFDDKITGPNMQDPLKIKGNYFENNNFRIPFILDQNGDVKFQDEYGNNVKTITIQSKDGTRKIILSIEDGKIIAKRHNQEAEKYQYLSISKNGETQNLQGHFIPGVGNKGEIQFYDKTTNQAVTTCKVQHDPEKGYTFDNEEQGKVDLKAEYFHDDLKQAIKNIQLPTNIPGVSESTLIEIFDQEFEKMKKENPDWNSQDGIIYANKFFQVLGNGSSMDLTPKTPEAITQLSQKICQFAEQLKEIANIQVNLDNSPIEKTTSGTTGTRLFFNTKNLVNLYQGTDALTIQLGNDLTEQNGMKNELTFKYQNNQFIMETQTVFLYNNKCVASYNGNPSPEGEDTKKRRKNDPTNNQKIVNLTSAND